MAITDEQTVARFVLRARRVKAHSLVQDHGNLAERLKEKLTFRLTVDGSGTVSRSLPADEEIFESLAARVRPLTLASEPIYYEKVIEALERLLAAAPEVTTEQRERLDELRAGWIATVSGRQVQAYAMQSVNLDGTGATGLVSDTQLAFGWMYADLVHADPKSEKKDALGFSLRERYAAAVSVFSRLAALTVETLRLVKELHDDGVVVVDEQMWTTDVVVAASEITYEGVIYTAAEGTDMPDLEAPFGQPDGPWTQLTVADQLRTDPAKRVRVELAATDGTTLAAYDAAVVHSERDNDILHWHVLVGDSLVVRVQFHVENETLVPQSIDAVAAGEAHRTRLAVAVFLINLEQAGTLAFHLPNEEYLRYTLKEPNVDALQKMRFTAELLEDLVGLEQLTGQPVGPFIRPLNLWERVRLRQAFLLWQGKAVQWDRDMPEMVSPQGVIPHGMTSDSRSVEIAGAPVTMPEVMVWHPEAAWHEHGSVPDSGPDARAFTATIPDGARWLAFSPSARPAEDDAPTEGEPWGLTGIDQDTCSF
ncbi:hypothetical protein [Umezawaea sp. Da 62-37]|uniref:hypothetical protein n=1 Tax=Umezawaea sp. Da 62-37 TaxID=3075927 RepID=UPI0028F6CE18|nr:hypothetical protein [Umezawaea sp. Da 62-37]WNV82897.1 hypothetical protein RM788_32485 [Umezawaea sp. Da 62-37]